MLPEFDWSEEECFSIEASDNPDDYEFDADWPSHPNRLDILLGELAALLGRPVPKQGEEEVLEGGRDPSSVAPQPPPEIRSYLIVACWKFHKNDADPWPSVLHGHHSERPLKLDALSGNIFNIHTRERVQKMKHKELARVQAVLLGSKDFGERARSLFAASS
jgi:hypothetical protein